MFIRIIYLVKSKKYETQKMNKQNFYMVTLSQTSPGFNMSAV